MTAGTPLEQPSAFASWAAAGFGTELVPVCGPNHTCQSPGKRPHLPGWQTVDVTPALLARWERDHRGNIGLRTRGFPTVDIDVDAPELVKAIEAVCLEVLGPAPTRYRANSARRARIYRLKGEPFDKAALNFTTPDGVKAKVEILADGQQVVVAGRHASGADLEWSEPPRADGLSGFSAAQVPTLLAELRRWLEEAGCTFPAPSAPSRTEAPVPIRTSGGDEAERGRQLARGYVATIDPAISGDAGHSQTLHIACRIVERVTSEADAWKILVEANEAKCRPPWSERELRHKLESALEKHQLGEKLPALLARRDERRRDTFPVLSIAAALATEEERLEHGVERIATGWPRLDAALGGGLSVPSLNVLGAPPKSGKSSWAQIIAVRHVEAGGVAYVLDLENGRRRILRQILCRRAELGPRDAARALADKRAGVFTSREAAARWCAAKDWVRDVLGPRLFVECVPPQDIEGRVAEARRVAGKDGKLLVLMDSLQKAPGDPRDDKRTTIDKWIRLLERIRYDYEATILVISEIRRGKEGYAAREDAFKESGGIEYAADLAITLNRPAADEDTEAPSVLRVELARDSEEDPRGDVASYRPVRPWYGLEEIDPVPLEPRKRAGKRAGAEEFLRDRLEGRAVTVQEALTAGVAAGYSESTIRRAAKVLRVQSCTVDLHAGWRLP